MEVAVTIHRGGVRVAVKNQSIIYQQLLFYHAIDLLYLLCYKQNVDRLNGKRLNVEILNVERLNVKPAQRQMLPNIKKTEGQNLNVEWGST
jgi:hypothetical protein